jgi:16S rRNA (cytosine967-C5)-methyltransferase
MTPAARLSAAIEVLADLGQRPRPASEGLADWGKAHRFAGSGDRAVIGNLVFDALRRRASLAWRMDDESPRAAVLALVAFHWSNAAEVQRLCDGSRFAPEPLSEPERRALTASRDLAYAPDHVRADAPDWVVARAKRVWGEGAVDELAALSLRAPMDLRVNTLKCDRARALRALEPLGIVPGAISPTALRIPAPVGPARAPNVEVEEAYQKGWVELQDEGSQVAALLAGAEPGEQVADLCAGGGGKTLALAATMENTGQLWAWDADKHRLAPIFQRLERAGARNVQVKRGGDVGELDGLAGRMDRVVLDVPCTGTGAWRRHPDTKWRLKEKALAERMAAQDAILARGAGLVRRGGTLVYVTCSLLAEENEDRVEAFLATLAGARFAPVDLAPRWRRLFGSEAPPLAVGLAGPGLRLTPRGQGTDGFYVCLLREGGR